MSQEVNRSETKTNDYYDIDFELDLSIIKWEDISKSVMKPLKSIDSGVSRMKNEPQKKDALPLGAATAALLIGISFLLVGTRVVPTDLTGLLISLSLIGGGAVAGHTFNRALTSELPENHQHNLMQAIRGFFSSIGEQIQKIINRKTSDTEKNNALYEEGQKDLESVSVVDSKENDFEKIEREKEKAFRGIGITSKNDLDELLAWHYMHRNDKLEEEKLIKLINNETVEFFGNDDYSQCEKKLFKKVAKICQNNPEALGILIGSQK